MLVGPYLPDPERPGKFRRTALFAFIDDYSRLIPYGEFFLRGIACPAWSAVLKLAILTARNPRASLRRQWQGLRLDPARRGLRHLGDPPDPLHPLRPEHQRQDRALLRHGPVVSSLPEVENGHLATLDDLNASFHAWLELVYHQRHPRRDRARLPRSFPAGPRPDHASGGRSGPPAPGIPLAGEPHGHPHRHALPPGQSLQRRSPAWRASRSSCASIPSSWPRSRSGRRGTSSAQAQVSKLERSRHLALDRIPPPVQEVSPEHVDFLAALRAEHQALAKSSGPSASPCAPSARGRSLAQEPGATRLDAKHVSRTLGKRRPTGQAGGLSDVSGVLRLQRDALQSRAGHQQAVRAAAGQEELKARLELLGA